MIHKSNPGQDRRILTYPAVHPCEAISPPTLLASLIDLANSICSIKSRATFSINRHNAVEMFRNVGNILVFLEEIDPSDVRNSSLLLSLSELHLVLQKIRFLLEDCTREGARLWLLMNSERVANQFRLLTRGMATAIDVVPLESVKVPDEVKEVVGLFMRQSRKAKFEIGFHDRKVMDEVNDILDQFQSGIAPDKDNLQHVLDYMGVRSWSECNKEVKFLDTETGFESFSGNDKKREVAFLSSLRGFMCYCRCVCFDVVDRITVTQCSSSNTSTRFLNSINPEDFRCPISLEFMVEPVTTVTGHTYDRSSILKWFRAGNPICPKTGESLTSMDLIPNVTVQKLIEQYCSDNDIHMPEPIGHRNRDITRTVRAGSAAAEKAMKMVGKFLVIQFQEGTSMERSKAAYEIRVLAKASIFNRSCLAESGVIPHLLELLTSSDATSQENAIAALLSLSKHSTSKAIIVSNDGLRVIVNVLKKGLKVEAQQHAAAALFYLASVEEYRKLIGEIPDTISALVEMVQNGTHRGKKNALVAIFGLLMHKANHKKALDAGAVPLLINLLTSSGREDLITDSLAVLSSLAEKSGGAMAILRAGAIPKVMEILRDSTSRTGKEYCVTLLLSLCMNGGKEAICSAVKSSSLMESLYSLLSDGTSRASKKAGALIRLLQEFYERSSCVLPSPVLPREQFIHAW